MSKWYAIKGPDGEIVNGSVANAVELSWEWFVNESHDMWKRSYSHKLATGVTLGSAARIVGESLGYRCVEVNLVEPEQAGALEQAFIQGAAWWEWHKEGATMWQSDRALALEEAERRAASGTLGQSPEVNTTTAGGGGEKGKP